MEFQRLAQELRAGGSISNAIQSRKRLPKALASSREFPRGPKDAQCTACLPRFASSASPVKRSEGSNRPELVTAVMGPSGDGGGGIHLCLLF